MSQLNALGQAVYNLCTEFMIHGANALGWTYVDANSVLLLIIFPAVPPLLLALALWQRRALRRLEERLREGQPRREAPN